MIKVIFRSFRHTNYRLFFVGQGISLVGTWMQQTAMSWLVYRLTGSALMLGLIGFSSQIPTFLVTPVAGVLADRLNRHRILIVTQILSMTQAFVLAVLVMTGAIHVWHLMALSLFLGFINAVDIPTRQSFVVDMIERRDDLPNAIALNSSLFNSARLIGPMIAGPIIALSGEGICFLLNGLSYLAVIASLLAMHIKRVQPAAKYGNPLQGLKEGFKYAIASSPIRAVLMLVASLSLVGIPYAVLLPIFAKNTFHGGPHTLGLLVGFTGLGALVGAIYLAARKTVRGLARIIALCAALFGAGLILFSKSTSLGFSLALLFVTGFSVIITMASCNTVLQTIVDDDKRGRVMSFYTLAFMGMAPFGSLLAGALAGKIGAPGTLMAGGIFCILAALIFGTNLPTFRKMLRPIYVRKGIIPEVASGLQKATEMTSPPKE